MNLRGIAFRVTAAMLGVVSSLLALEIVLRFLPVNEGLHTLPLNAENPIVRFEPNRASTWSRGWNFTLLNEVRTNNYGFINDGDYDEIATSPLLAVIGDSYVEAAMVPFSETFAGRLAWLVDSRARVYSFGASGTALSGYLEYSRYARDRFRPHALVITVVGNDFDESLMKYNTFPGGHFVQSADGSLTLQRADFAPTLPHRLVRKSRLAMYLTTNVGLADIAYRVLSGKNNGNEVFVGNTSAAADSLRLADSKAAVDAFLDQLPAMAGLPPSAVLFVLDGMRPHLYDRETAELARGSYVDRMRNFFTDAAAARGYELVDMEPIFRDHYAGHGQRFEHPKDGHWNSLGHELVFQEITVSRVFGEFLLQAP